MLLRTENLTQRTKFIISFSRRATDWSIYLMRASYTKTLSQQTFSAKGRSSSYVISGYRSCKAAVKYRNSVVGHYHICHLRNWPSHLCPMRRAIFTLLEYVSMSISSVFILTWAAIIGQITTKSTRKDSKKQSYFQQARWLKKCRDAHWSFKCLWNSWRKWSSARRSIVLALTTWRLFLPRLNLFVITQSLKN